MTTTVATIYDSVLGIVAANVPAGFTELPFVHNLEQNDSRRLDNSYGLRFLDGPFSDSVTRSYTIDQGFELVLTRTNPRQTDDSDLISAEKELYGVAGDVLKELINTQAGEPSIVLLVTQPSFSEPEILSENQYVALRVQFIIRYRELL